jgi:hypothetical protein
MVRKAIGKMTAIVRQGAIEQTGLKKLLGLSGLGPMPLLSTPTVPVGHIRNLRDGYEKFFIDPMFCHDIENKLRDPQPVAGQ